MTFPDRNTLSEAQHGGYTAQRQRNVRTCHDLSSSCGRQEKREGEKKQQVRSNKIGFVIFQNVKNVNPNKMPEFCLLGFKPG